MCTVWDTKVGTNKKDMAKIQNVTVRDCFKNPIGQFITGVAKGALFTMVVGLACPPCAAGIALAKPLLDAKKAAGAIKAIKAEGEKKDPDLEKLIKEGDSAKAKVKPDGIARYGMENILQMKSGTIDTLIDSSNDAAKTDAAIAELMAAIKARA